MPGAANGFIRCSHPYFFSRLMSEAAMRHESFLSKYICRTEVTTPGCIFLSLPERLLEFQFHRRRRPPVGAELLRGL